MAYRPPLPADVYRRIVTRLKELRAERGFDGRHWDWLKDRDRRKQAAGWRIKSYESEYGFYDVITGAPIHPIEARNYADRPLVSSTSWKDYVQLWKAFREDRPESLKEWEKVLSELDAMMALQDDPDTGDLIGRGETVDYLVRAFDIIADECFDYWKKEPKLSYRAFIALLAWARQLAIKQIRKLWRGRGVPPEPDPDRRDWRDWVDRMVVPDANPQLEGVAFRLGVRAQDAQWMRRAGLSDPFGAVRDGNKRAEAAEQAREAEPQQEVEVRPRKERGIRINGELITKCWQESGLKQATFIEALGTNPTVLRKMMRSGRIDETTLSSFRDKLNTMEHLLKKLNGGKPFDRADLILLDESS